jgi:hypothetical protein
MRCFLCSVRFLVPLTFAAAAARAEAPLPSKETVEKQALERLPAPTRLVPHQVDLLIQAPQPCRLLSVLTAEDLLKPLQQVAPVQEVLHSTKVRRLGQLVAYFEKELGLPWPQLLDRLAGRGVIIGVQFAPNPTPVLLVVEGEDEPLMQQFFQLGLKVLAQELARQEAKDKPIKGSYKEYSTIRIGANFHAAVAGRALFLSNSEKALHAGLDCHRSGGKGSMADVSSIKEAAQLLPPQPLVSLWLNMTKLRQTPGAKAAYKDPPYKDPPRNDPALTIGYGQYLNLLGRTPFVCAGVYRDKAGFLATVRTPCGREDMGADRFLHLPLASAPGSRPLLKPKNVLYSESKYFNIANVWKERAALFNEKQVQQLEQFENKVAPFLVGARLSKLLMQAGPYYRFVAVHQAGIAYKTTPKISLPAFALVWELREPEALGKSLETILRGVALLAGGKADLRLIEEQYQGCKLVGYRFPEDRPLLGDVYDLRFNFTPCFTRVGDQFVVSSTLDLCRELVDLLRQEGGAPSRGQAATTRASLYGAGAAAYLQTFEDLLVTQTALDQAVTPKEAREQIKALVDVLRGVGELALEARFHAKAFQYDVRLRTDFAAKAQTVQKEK